jgi:hypothetical protein
MNLLKNTFIFSAIGHLAVFGVFGFSFGNRIPLAGYSQPSFWGSFLMNSQLYPAKSQPELLVNLARLPWSGGQVSHWVIRNGVGQPLILSSLKQAYFKPLVPLSMNVDKLSFKDSPVQKPKIVNKQEPSLILHPVLPYGFALYFKDRQVAHVELEYRFSSGQNSRLILLKRKISSGNLEVDLLSMRNIWHYLFIQRANFTPGDWHTVKIDLSAGNR